MFTGIRKLLKSFWHQEGGNISMVVGLGMITLIAAIGSSIDLGRAQMVQAKLSSALDAAGLAAGAVANSEDVNEVANNYFHANFPSSYMNVTLSPLDIVTNDDNSVINLSVTATVPTTLMAVVGKQSITVRADSEITRANKGMELVLVMDNTGSMDDDNKLEDMQAAATDLINILYGDNATVDNLWIGLVPFSQAVNIGPSRTSWVNAGSFNWGTTSWMGCVDAREASSRDITDDPPSVARFPKYYWPCHTTNNAWFGTNSSRNNCSSGSGVRYKSGLGTELGPNKYCSQSVTPMTSNKTTILNAISAMTAAGNTHVNIGAVWGWRMLSPRWRGLWGGEMNTNNLPLDYHAPLMNKVVIILTDGENTMSNSAHSAYWYLSDGKLGTTNSSTAVTRLNTRLTQVCTSMKNNGVLVYTVAFGSPGSTIETLMRNCATNPDYYFDSPTGEDLERAFHTIADSLANLRISK